MGRLHRPVFFFFLKPLYLDFKAQRNDLYRCHGTVILEANMMREGYDKYLIRWPNFVLI